MKQLNLLRMLLGMNWGVARTVKYVQNSYCSVIKFCMEACLFFYLSTR